jgi:hypothetical protein
VDDAAERELLERYLHQRVKTLFETRLFRAVPLKVCGGKRGRRRGSSRA